MPKFTISLAMNIRAYGFVEVEADDVCRPSRAERVDHRAHHVERAGLLREILA